MNTLDIVLFMTLVCTKTNKKLTKVRAYNNKRHIQCFQRLTCLVRPFTLSSHTVQSHTCWDASCTLGLPNQRQVKVDWYELLCFGNPTVRLVSQHVWLCTVWLDPTKGLHVLQPSFSFSFWSLANTLAGNCQSSELHVNSHVPCLEF